MNTDLQSSVLELIKKNRSGVSNKKIQSAHPSVENKQLVDVINALSALGKIQICRRGTHTVYKVKKCSLRNIGFENSISSNEEDVIYQLIEGAGNKGIWVRTIRYQSRLPQTQVHKILKSLESKKLIKSVPSVAASKKKVYMLYALEPDRSVTGGTWYTDQEFDTEFVDVLTQQCLVFLQRTKAEADATLHDAASRRKSSFMSLSNICQRINNTKLSKVELSVQDIETILDSLVYDGKLEKSESMYRVVEPLLAHCGLMNVPCGVCPVHDECRDGGIVSPTSCAYMKEWLDF